jgi:hypothetical protein
MVQRIEFRFGKNSSFECDIEQIIVTEPWADAWSMLGATQWVWIKSSVGGHRAINTARCTQIIIGLPDKEAT